LKIDIFVCKHWQHWRSCTLSKFSPTSRGQILYQIWTKWNNLRLCYSDLKV